MDAADEIGLAVVATTLSIVAVFLPVALMPGISGQFFKSFGYTVVITVLMSLLVARMITPLMAAYFLRAKGVQPHAAGWAMFKYLDVLKWSIDSSKATAIRAALPRVSNIFAYAGLGALIVVLLMAAFGVGAFAVMKALAGLGLPVITTFIAIVAGTLVAFGVGKLIGRLARARGGNLEMTVGRLSAWVQDHRIVMVGAGLGTLIMTGVLVANLGMQFQPPLNLDFSRVRIGMPPGATLAQTEAKVQQAASIVEKDPDVEHVFQRVFVGAGFLNVVLAKDREKTSTEFERGLTPQLSSIPDAQVSFLSQGGGGPGGAPRDIMLYLGSDNPELLLATANKIADEMQTVPELVAPRVQGDLVRPEITIKPRFDLAADLGVTTQALSQTIRIATLGDIAQNSAKFSLADRQVPITVSLSENSRRDMATLLNLPVPTSSGGSVPLKAVAEIGFGSGPTTVQRTNQIRRILRSEE